MPEVILIDGNACPVPVEVESAGREAVAAWVTAQAKPSRPAKAPPVPVAPPEG